MFVQCVGHGCTRLSWVFDRCQKTLGLLTALAFYAGKIRCQALYAIILHTMK
jgi:hypothetical protein